MSNIIYQYDLNRNLIKEWNSLSEIAEELGYNKSCILKCCDQDYKQSYGFIWSYVKLRKLRTTKNKDPKPSVTVIKEEWLNIDDFYQVSNKGRVRKIKTIERWHNQERIIDIKPKQLKTTYNELTGATDVYLHNKRASVHILVAKAFVPNPNNLKYIGRIDGNLRNNRADNLFWK